LIDQTARHANGIACLPILLFCLLPSFERRIGLTRIQLIALPPVGTENCAKLWNRLLPAAVPPVIKQFVGQPMICVFWGNAPSLAIWAAMGWAVIIITINPTIVSLICTGILANYLNLDAWNRNPNNFVGLLGMLIVSKHRELNRLLILNIFQ
jgi:hypothetical protein